MKIGGHERSKAIIFLFPLLVLFSICKKPETATILKHSAYQDSAQLKVAELILNNQSDFEESISTILKLIKEKEAELHIAQQELKQREEQLAKIEIEAKKLRNISYFILAIGWMLVMIGLFLIFSKRKSENY